METEFTITAKYIIYQAKWWTVGENPETCGQWGVWKQV